MKVSKSSYIHLLSAILLAALLGVTLRVIDGDGESAFVAGLIGFFKFVGSLFVQALKMVIVPLVGSSVIASLAGLGGTKDFGRLGLKTLGFYLTSSFVAILIGLTVVNLIQPGLSGGEPNTVIKEAFQSQAGKASEAEKAKVELAGSRKPGDFLGLFKKMIPANIFSAASHNSQLLGLITFSILVGIALTCFPKDQVSSLTQGITAFSEVMMLITRWIMKLAPIGVFGLILPVIYSTGLVLFVQLGKYFFTVLIALGIHFFLVLPLFLKYFAKVSPFQHFKAVRSALLTAFSTASSAATIPTTLSVVQEKVGVSKRVSSFTLPLGATVNMDGTALYECVAVLFVAQVMGVDMSLVVQAGVVIAALLTSIGVAGVPSASLVAILLILQTSGIPGAELAIVALLTVDRLLDMCRTAVNVYSDSCAATVIAKSEGETLKV